MKKFIAVLLYAIALVCTPAAFAQGTQMSFGTPSVTVPMACTLTANPPVVSQGNPATLSWGTSLNAVSFAIDQGIGVLTPVAGGTVITKPLYVDTTFTGTATNLSGSSVTCFVTVTVIGPPGIPSTTCSLELEPSSVELGGSSTVVWKINGPKPSSFSLEVRGSESGNGHGFGAVNPPTSGKYRIENVMENMVVIGTVAGPSGQTSTCVTVLSVGLLGRWESYTSGAGEVIEDNMSVGSTPGMSLNFRLTWAEQQSADTDYYSGYLDGNAGTVGLYHYKRAGMIEMYARVRGSVGDRFWIETKYLLYLQPDGNYAVGKMDGAFMDYRAPKPLEVFHDTARMCRNGCKG